MFKLQLFTRWILCFLFLLGFGARAQTNVCIEAAAESLDAWRSSDRFLPGGVLRNELEIYLTKETRDKLYQCSRPEMYAALKALATAKSVDIADAENLVKMQQIIRLMRNGDTPFWNFEDRPIHGLSDEIIGLDHHLLEAELARENFAPVGDRPKAAQRRFNFRAHMLIQLAFKYAMDNDHYGFTIPGVLRSEGMHESAEVVMEVSSRGADRYPFQVVGGTDQVIDMFENLHMERWMVEDIRRRADQQLDIDPGYWDWLARKAWRPNLRGMRDGTVAFPGEGLLYVKDDPASAILEETLINPWMSTMTNFLTAGVRNVMSAGGLPADGGIPLSETGTRRAITGRFGSLTALLAGAAGTSNMLMAFLTDSKSFGSMQHASFGMWETEYDAFEAIFKRAKGPMLGLPDMTDTEYGLKQFLMASGSKVSDSRQDSNIYQSLRYLSTLETAAEMIDINAQLGRGKRGAVLSNDLREEGVREARRSGINIQSIGMGGGFQVPPVGHGNMIYKIVSFRDKATGRVRHRAKIANGAKSVWPEEKSTVRFYGPDGKMLRDRSYWVEEPREPGAHVLQETLAVDGERVIERATPARTVPFIHGQIAQLPEALKNLDETRTSLEAQGANYKHDFSDDLNRMMLAAKLAATPPDEKRVLVLPGMFDVLREDGVVKMLKFLDFVYGNPTKPDGFDQIILVPASDQGSRRRAPHLDGQTRAEQIRFRTRPMPEPEKLTAEAKKLWEREQAVFKKVEVWEGEVDGIGGRTRTITTLEAIQRKVGSKAKIYVGLGEDDFWRIGDPGHEWYRAPDVLRNYNFAVVHRVVPSELAPARAATLEMVKDFLPRQSALDNPNGNRIQFLLNEEMLHENVVGQEVRDFYDKQGFVGMFHVTDPQWTFLMRSLIPGLTQKEDGSLAVAGTQLTVDRIMRAVVATYQSRMMKLSVSGDAHFQAELDDPKWNGEFHGKFKFAEHGMKGVQGPKGDAFIEEFDAAIPKEKQVLIPCHMEVEIGGKRHLQMVQFTLAQIEAHMSDPESVLHFEKNGPESYNVFVNPRYLEYLQRIDPYKMLPHSHNAWAMDFCTYNVVKRELELGYRVYLIVDATAGVFPNLTGPRLRELAKLGVKFITTAEYLDLLEGWKARKANWAQVRNELTDWEKTSTTQSWMEKELQKPIYRDLSPDEPLVPGETVFNKPARSGRLFEGTTEEYAHDVDCAAALLGGKNVPPAPKDPR